ncbi:unnamed protein product [Caenorhabditis bovis]|uniref:Protein AF-10 n=1 Tax=Caenorhabditis bovis TaxID=2654633 RepID=A0A8S1ERI7_9PELO|nr:unnamed protein product [Caenorhabditis bovis]
MKEMLGGCCVCADENGWTDNPLIYCDGPNCEVAVHQGCYGIQEVPEGEWFCAKCNVGASTSTAYTNGSKSGHFRCELCPSGYGALKRTEKKGWAHVICALYIPEVRFGDVHSMEPVILSDVPSERFDKLCYICDSAGKRGDAKLGACMSCNKSGCKRGFHVTCAQQKGLLCEEGGISKNVKYCGYCENHLRKAQNDPLIKVIPACPVTRLPTQPSPPPSSNNSAHMLVDTLPRPDQANKVLGLGTSNGTAAEEATRAFGSTTTFSPPLTSSSRSSVALDTTPPLASGATAAASAASMASTQPAASTSASAVTINGNGAIHHQQQQHMSNSETSVAAHLQQMQYQAQNAAAKQAAQNAAHQYAQNILSSQESQNGIYPSQNNHNSYLAALQNEYAGRLPASVSNMLAANSEYQINGASDLEEKTVKAVLTAPLASAKAKRLRDAKADLLDKGHKRPRTINRPSTMAGSASSGAPGGVQSPVNKSTSMQRLISLVAPVVSETVSDFQRDRIADRTAAERRAAAAMTAPSTSTTSIELTNGQALLNSITMRTHSGLPTSMEQLLERQWDQGAQMLINQSQFDVAQLLNCLHQLKSENIRLEDQLYQLTKRREHLVTLNQRLSQPLGNATTMIATPQNHSPQVTTAVRIGDEASRHTSRTVPIVSLVASSATTTTTTSVQPTVTSTPNNRATPSTAGQPLASTPIMSSTASTTGNIQQQPQQQQDFSNISPERLAQMTALNSIYRNNILDPALLTQIMLNQSYINNQTSNLSNNVFTRILQQPQMAAAAAALASNVTSAAAQPAQPAAAPAPTPIPVQQATATSATTTPTAIGK